MNLRLNIKTCLFIFVLSAIGYIGNVYSLPVGYGVNFLFGSIFVVIAAYFLGSLPAFVTALLSSSYTYILWNHPFAIIIFTCEALFLGITLKRTKNIVLLDFIFWLTMGLPLVFLFYYFVMSLGANATITIFFKQTVNGLFNALIASVLINYLPLQKIFKGKNAVKNPLSYATVVFHLTACFLMIPSITLLLTGNYRESKTLQQMLGESVLLDAREAKDIIESWLDRHINATKLIAETGRQFSLKPSSQLQEDLEIIKRSFPDFHNVLVADSNATTVAFCPAVNEKGESTIGINFSDREWFKQLRSTHKPYVSDVFLGRGGIFVPIFSISSPIIEGGAFRGLGLGAVNLDRLRILLDYNVREKNSFLTIYDKNFNIVCSTKPGRASLSKYAREKEGKLVDIGNGVTLLIPRSKKNVSFMDTWREAVYFVSLPVKGTSWTLLSEASVAPIQSYLYRETITGLGLVFFLFVVAIFISFFVSRWFAKEPTLLASISKDLGTKLAKGSELEWPESNILEVSNLIANFKAAATALQSQFEEIKAINANLECRVEERTKEVLKTNRSLLESKTRLRTLIETIPDLVWLKDPNGVYLACNPKFERVIGAKESEIVGKTDYDFVDKALADFLREKDKAAMELGRSTVNEEEITYAEDGHREILETIKTPVYGNEGSLVGVLGIARDITERKEMEEKLRHAYKMEAIGTLAGGIAHDFNNILAVILGYADMAREGISEESQTKNYIDQVLKAGNRARELVKQILTFSRKGMEKQEQLQPSVIIKEGLKLMRASLPTTIDIREDIDSECGSIIANPTNVHQVLINLCTNALHAMAEEKGILTVKLKRVAIGEQEEGLPPDASAGTFIELLVSDSGCGMDKKTMERIFEPYFTTKEVGRGSGMGLALVHGIVQGCGGFIKVESEPGFGSTFHVYFPALAEGSGVVEEEKESESLPLGDERIMTVDDEKIIIGMYKATLEKLGYKVTAHTSSEKSLEEFRRSPESFDLIITDQTMPCISGADLAKEILRIRPNIPVILCTGYSSMITEEKAKKIGITRFLMKPVSRKDLALSVREVLDKGGTRKS